jgi:hypothetical protein
MFKYAIMKYLECLALFKDEKSMKFEISPKPINLSYNLNYHTPNHKVLQQQIKRTKNTLNQNQCLIKLLLVKMNNLVDLIKPTFEKLNSNSLKGTEVITDDVIPCNHICEDLTNQEEFC